MTTPTAPTASTDNVLNIANLFNSASDKFNFSTDGLEFETLSQLFENDGLNARYPVNGIFINTKSKYDDQGIIVSDHWLVSIPSHLTPVVERMLNSDELINACNDGKFGFSIRQYKNKDGDLCHTVYWVNL